MGVGNPNLIKPIIHQASGQYTFVFMWDGEVKKAKKSIEIVPILAILNQNYAKYGDLRLTTRKAFPRFLRPTKNRYTSATIHITICSEMEQFSHDLTLALEETSKIGGVRTGRWGVRRRTRSTGNLRIPSSFVLRDQPCFMYNFLSFQPALRNQLRTVPAVRRMELTISTE